MHSQRMRAQGVQQERIDRLTRLSEQGVLGHSGEGAEIVSRVRVRS